VQGIRTTPAALRLSTLSRMLRAFFRTLRPTSAFVGLFVAAVWTRFAGAALSLGTARPLRSRLGPRPQLQPAGNRLFGSRYRTIAREVTRRYPASPGCGSARGSARSPAGAAGVRAPRRTPTWCARALEHRGYQRAADNEHVEEHRARQAQPELLDLTLRAEHELREAATFLVGRRPLTARTPRAPSPWR